MRNGTFEMNGELSPVSDVTRDLMSSNNPFLEKGAPTLETGHYMIYIFDPNEEEQLKLYRSKNLSATIFRSKSGHAAIAVAEDTAYRKQL